MLKIARANCVPPDGAAGMWNSAQGSGGQGINFHIELNQATQNPNILIVRDNTLSSSRCAYINLDPPGGPYVMHLPGSMAGNDLWRVVESTAHEIGHAIGLADIPDETAKTECGYSDIMAPAANGCFSQVGKSVTARDVDQSRKGMDNNVRATCESQLNNQLKIDESAASPTPTPTPPPSCPDNCPNPQQYAPATCFGPVDWCQYPDTGCESGLQENGRCCCSWNTPIIIDTLGDGFSLTEPENGVVFDITGLGAPEQISWTE